ncbi:hypothetical protein [Pseudanabaena sp. PCC 6802]|uniref:hypothetical protein n=1 Tax=Pseudanabaena sp. PCC 6802 TaxID=118173 RepID=UPI00037A7A7E|nr:hypothetical protein [Pseudanabaena sp. PCC 6802]
MQPKILYAAICGSMMAVFTVFVPSSLDAQIAIGSNGSSSNSVPLSHQTLQEMRPTSAPLSGSSMEFLRFGKEVTVTPVESVKSAIDWLSGGTTTDRQTVKVDPDQAFERAIANFKEQQKLEIGASTPISIEKLSQEKNTRN